MSIKYAGGVLGDNGITATTASVPFSMATAPPSARVGHFAIVSISVSSTTPTMSTVPSGWALRSPSPVATGSVINFFVYTKVLTAADVGLVTHTWVLSTTTRPVGIMDIFSGVDQFAPIDADAQNPSFAAAPAVTSTHAYDWIYNVWAARNSTGGPATITVPGTHTAASYSATNFGSGSVINNAIGGGYLTTPPVAAGSYGPYTATYGVSSSSVPWSFALKAAPANHIMFA